MKNFLIIFIAVAATSNAADSTNAKIKYLGLDCHMHVHPDGEEIQYDGKRVLLAVQSAGLSHACILSQGYQKSSNPAQSQLAFTQQRNDWTMGESAKYSQLIPFCGVPILLEWAPREVERCVTMGAKGLKLHQASEQFSFLNAKEKEAAIKVLKAAKNKLVVLIHLKYNENEIKEFYSIARDFGETKFIVAHSLGTKMQLLKEAPKNVFADISGIVMAPISAGANIVNQWKAMGLDRVIFGSDWPIFHPAEHGYYLQQSPISGKEKKMIFKDNAQELFSELK